ncbi:hypothetical protein DEIPH_ctg001orf0050 [Deinococcus phoenicis]|uniref:Lipoprotein n=1 Tax=Deinococcus phoenicis TaxID=1476583 RepID=A0A016QVB8_9DEIO|nr:hypothetical protein DEIPH_ctg001orf0050 [Deinococcus phoenicis]
MKVFPVLALALSLAACAPRDPAAHETSLTDEEQREGRKVAFIVPVPKGAQGVAYGVSSGLYSVSPLPDEAHRRGRLRVTVGTDSQRCLPQQLQVGLGMTGFCVSLPAEGFSGWSLEGGLTGLNLWAPLYVIVPGQRPGSGEPPELPARSRWEVAAVALTTTDGEESVPPGLPEPSSVLAALDENGHLRQP